MAGGAATAMPTEGKSDLADRNAAPDEILDHGDQISSPEPCAWGSTSSIFAILAMSVTRRTKWVQNVGRDTVMEDVAGMA